MDTMNLPVFIIYMVAASLGLYLYVWQKVRTKRQAMSIITIPERRLYQTACMVATVILFSIIVMLATALLN